MRTQVLEFRLCPHCASLMPAKAARCARCSRAAASPTAFLKTRGRLRRAISRLRERRYARKRIATILCPNCCIALPKGAPRCAECDWVNEGRTPARFAPRRFARAVGTKLTYKKSVYCAHCENMVRSATDFCPDCLNPFLTRQRPPSLAARAGERVRKVRVQKAVERATLCPTCEIYLPDWSEQCYGCGWTRPVDTDMRSRVRHLMKSTRQKFEFARRQASQRRQQSDDLCPHCDVCVPLSDPMCMICGWNPDRKRSFTGSLRALRVGRARKAVIARQKRRRVCEECDLPILPGDAGCMVCGWKPAPSRLQNLVEAARRRPRRVVAPDESSRLCPNCRLSMPEDAGRCGSCGWDREPARSWARHPKMIWLAPLCLLIYGILLTTFLHMADPLGSFGHVDQYGRNTGEHTKQLTSARH